MCFHLFPGQLLLNKDINFFVFPVHLIQYTRMGLSEADFTGGFRGEVTGRIHGEDPFPLVVFLHSKLEVPKVLHEFIFRWKLLSRMEGVEGELAEIREWFGKEDLKLRIY